ncbi:hypothetical protein AVEN_96100-1 [Araneus ventricosus]|uniref:Uncharacterized protein n=1 Tax=Araneus ventricosus TaxID=182803 RepID=A0A4Y2B3F0_ARAVE|nr:hypothetical protein AVEN_96100-1 [Araneus ventricosus]
MTQFSLIKSTFRFEPTQGLLWDGYGNFKSCSDDEDDTRLSLLSGFSYHTNRRKFDPPSQISCTPDPDVWRIFGETKVRTWNPLVMKPKPYHEITAVLFIQMGKYQMLLEKKS